MCVQLNWGGGRAQCSFIPHERNSIALDGRDGLVIPRCIFGPVQDIGLFFGRRHE